MKKNKTLSLIIFFAIFTQTVLFSQVKELREITVAIKNSDTKTIYKHCEKSISLHVPGTIGQYSKTQARKIIDQFFKKQKVIEVKSIETQSKKDDSFYTIIEYQSQIKRYNILIRFKKVDDKFLIQIFHILEIKQ